VRECLCGLCMCVCMKRHSIADMRRGGVVVPRCACACVRACVEHHLWEVWDPREAVLDEVEAHAQRQGHLLGRRLELQSPEPLLEVVCVCLVSCVWLRQSCVKAPYCV
jgi:hypothetical protein